MAERNVSTSRVCSIQARPYERRVVDFLHRWQLETLSHESEWWSSSRSVDGRKSYMLKLFASADTLKEAAGKY